MTIEQPAKRNTVMTDEARPKSVRLSQWLENAYAGRALVLVILALVMQYPVYKVDRLICERQAAQQALEHALELNPNYQDAATVLQSTQSQ